MNEPTPITPLTIVPPSQQKSRPTLRVTLDQVLKATESEPLGTCKTCTRPIYLLRQYCAGIDTAHHANSFFYVTVCGCGRSQSLYVEEVVDEINDQEMTEYPGQSKRYVCSQAFCEIDQDTVSIIIATNCRYERVVLRQIRPGKWMAEPVAPGPDDDLLRAEIEELQAALPGIMRRRATQRPRKTLT